MAILKQFRKAQSDPTSKTSWIFASQFPGYSFSIDYGYTSNHHFLSKQDAEVFKESAAMSGLKVEQRPITTHYPHDQPHKTTPYEMTWNVGIIDDPEGYEEFVKHMSSK